MTAGYFYIAINDSSIGALMVSARRVREVDPEHPISVVTDTPLSAEDATVFDKIIMVPHQIDIDGLRDLPAYPHQGFMGKAKYYYDSPYDVTIFLDNDIYMASSIAELFGAADVYDMAGSFCAGHWSGSSSIPDYMTMINTGMIMYRKCEAVKDFMARWWELMVERSPDPYDQTPFIIALWDMRERIKFLTLPYEYNFRFIFPMYAWGRVKVMHGRFDGVAQAAEKLNTIIGAPRVWYWNDFVCWFDSQKGLVKA